MPRAKVLFQVFTFAALGAGASVGLLAVSTARHELAQPVTKPTEEQGSGGPTPAEIGQPGVRVVYAAPRFSSGDPSWADPPKTPTGQEVTLATASHGEQEAERAGDRATEELAALAVPDATKQASMLTPAQGPPEGHTAVGLVDLNTAALEELNALIGGGLIGRAIIRGRPYQSADELLHKRVLNRATFERIKDQVAVR